MSEKRKKTIIASLIVLIILVADQALKLWVHSAFYLNEEYVITDWFRLHYIENDGIAFGITLFDSISIALFVKPVRFMFKIVRQFHVFLSLIYLHPSSVICGFSDKLSIINVGMKFALQRHFTPLLEILL